MIGVRDPLARSWYETPLPGRDKFGRILPRSTDNGWDHLPSSFKAPNRGRSFRFKRRRLICCWNCSARFEGWGRRRYCSSQCVREARHARLTERLGYDPSFVRYHGARALPVTLRMRPVIRDWDLTPLPEHPGLEVAIPLSVELLDAVARLVVARFVLPAQDKRLHHWEHDLEGKVAVPMPKVSDWDRFLHDLLLGALRSSLKTRKKS